MMGDETTHPEDIGTPRCRPSGGWKRWFILAGLFMVVFLETGSYRTLSLFLDDLTFQYDVSTSYMGAVYGFVSGMPYFLGLLTVPLLHHFSVRQLIIFGGILISGGLVAASYTTTIAEITAALITFGFGFVFVVLPLNSSPAEYFPDHFEIATGIFISGGSVGVMVMPWIFEILKDLYGWRGALLLLGAFTTHVILIGSLLKPAKIQRSTEGNYKTPRKPEASGHTNTNYITDSLDLETTSGDCRNDCSDKELHNMSKDETTTNVTTAESFLDCDESRVNSCYEDHEQNKDQSTSSKISDVNNFAGTCKEQTIRTKTSHGTSGQGAEGEVTSPNNESDINLEIAIKDDVTTKSCCNCLFSTARFFKEHPLMILVCVQIYLFALPYGTWLLFTIPNAKAKGLSDLRAAQLSVAGGVANFLGRFSCGFITSRKLARIEIWYMTVNIISAIAFFVNYVADSFWFLLFLSLLFGFTIGFKTPAQLTLVMNAVGEKYFKIGLGIQFLCGGSALPIVGVIAGAIFDRTQSYNIAFCIMGCLDVIAALLIITPLVWKRVCKKTVI